jgi:hypothetical protein
MGYNTDYSGTIHIENLDLAKIRILKKYLGQDKRDLKGRLIDPQTQTALPFYHFDVVLNEDLTGLRWDDRMEKTYGMLEMLNFLRQVATLEFREGDAMVCQGEDSADRYLLVVENNEMVKRPLVSESQGKEVFLTIGQYYDEQDIGGVFADKSDAEEYIAKKDDGLNWEVIARTLA